MQSSLFQSTRGRGGRGRGRGRGKRTSDTDSDHPASDDDDVVSAGELFVGFFLLPSVPSSFFQEFGAKKKRGAATRGRGRGRGRARGRPAAPARKV